MYELKKIERCLRVNLLGTGHRLMKKEFIGLRSHKGWETLLYTLLRDPEFSSITPVMAVTSRVILNGLVNLKFTLFRKLFLILKKNCLLYDKRGKIDNFFGWSIFFERPASWLQTVCAVFRNMAVRPTLHQFHYRR